MYSTKLKHVCQKTNLIGIKKMHLFSCQAKPVHFKNSCYLRIFSYIYGPFCILPHYHIPYTEVEFTIPLEKMTYRLLMWLLTMHRIAGVNNTSALPMVKASRHDVGWPCVVTASWSTQAAFGESFSIIGHGFAQKLRPFQLFTNPFKQQQNQRNHKKAELY